VDYTLLESLRLYRGEFMVGLHGLQAQDPPNRGLGDYQEISSTRRYR